MASSSALLRKAVDKTEAMDTAVKWSLLERVNDSVKELQLKCTSERSSVLNNDETTNSFLWVLEAVFIHGLTNSFLRSAASSASSPFSSLMKSSFFSSARGSGGAGGSGSDSQAVPNPSIWEFVLVFLHRDIIDQINSLHLIHTDVGRCRSWLRIALNDGLLLSFLENMTLKSNRRCLRSFYRSSAFLRDGEKCDILKNYLMGVELLEFRLVINNSFLNHWNSGPLSLVGLWVDENESVQQGVDVAQNLESKEFQAIPKLHQRQQNGGTPPRFYAELDSVLRRPPPLLSTDDALRIILSSSPRATPQPVQQKTVSQPKRMPLSSSSPKQKLNTVQTSKNVASSSKPSPSRSRSPLKVQAHDNVSVEEAQDPLAEDKRSSPKNQPVITTPTSEPVSKTSKPNETPAVIINGPQELPDAPSTNMDESATFMELELESPMVERSYTDLLLKYQQRSQNQQQQLQQPDAQNEKISEETNEENPSSLIHHDSLGESCDFTGNHSPTTALTASVTSSSGGSGSCKSGTKTRRRRRNTSLHHVKPDIVDGLELIKSPLKTKEHIMELLPRISKYTKIIAPEAGLDSQNYACKMCGTSIGMIYGAARLCHFTGFSYCNVCHLNQESVIPSRILLNYDFGLYAVCNQAHDFLEELKDEPIFDVNEINPTLYDEIDECGQAKHLRTKLYYIGMYLKTCKNSKALEELRKEGSSKPHLLESIHMYSLTDLLAIPNRSLATLLTKLVSTGSAHILSCTICREKGFICEVCRSPQVVFPFELERIFKCCDCGAVYHNKCMSPGQPCPRCVRWKKYQENEKAELSNQDE
ncbi:Pleckstrin y domain-containing family M member 3 [Orchesella cincta]|uniref:Pleckstrin y domain-containing family M member 3 n=1 Tax=Orchesella cincta TaxID=48709 RepID=A0A1D2MCU6_ORCCI|nr:Pleckstrin y domain-containing family M member 3 [Orchesella cincta]